MKKEDTSKRSTKIDVTTPILDGEVTVTPRPTNYIVTEGEDQANILSNPVYPLSAGEIYTPEEAEAVRNGDLSVKAVVDAHDHEVSDGTKIVDKATLVQTDAEVKEAAEKENPTSYDEELLAKKKDTK